MQRHVGLIAALGLIGGMGAMAIPAAWAAGPANTGTAPVATPASMVPAPTTAATSTNPNAGMPAHAVTKAAVIREERPEWNHETAIVQEALDSVGEHVTVDGVWGPQTTAALRDYQRTNGLQVTGRLDQPTRNLLDPIG